VEREAQELPESLATLLVQIPSGPLSRNSPKAGQRCVDGLDGFSQFLFGSPVLSSGHYQFNPVSVSVKLFETRQKMESEL
jgi:hypothetical protein